MRGRPRLETVEQILYYLGEARSGQSELLMKEVWENCRDREDIHETERELDLVIAFLEGRKRELLSWLLMRG